MVKTHVPNCVSANIASITLFYAIYDEGNAKSVTKIS